MAVGSGIRPTTALPVPRLRLPDLLAAPRTGVNQPTNALSQCTTRAHFRGNSRELAGRSGICPDT
ncbi:hypothetical protein NGM37_56400, partial [Streptomyces sp. TRM76130]|nr:hypothetical protein [Streptomyces sp. TRM76130]